MLMGRWAGDGTEQYLMETDSHALNKVVHNPIWFPLMPSSSLLVHGSAIPWKWLGWPAKQCRATIYTCLE